MDFCDTKVDPELDVKPAIMANGHMVGHDENFFTLTFIQSVPKYLSANGSTVTMKYTAIGNIALSHEQARSLARKILRELEEVEGNGPSTPLS